RGGGRTSAYTRPLLAVGFGLARRERKGILAHFHRYGHVKLPDMITMLSEAGLKAVEAEPWEFATCSMCSPYRIRSHCSERIQTMRRHSPVRARAWMLALGVVILIAGHGIVLYYFASHVTLSAAVVSGAIVLAVSKHLGLLPPA